MNQKIIAVTGISGVGKTTFLHQLAELIDFQHVSADSLIATAREAAPEARDVIRYADLSKNQCLLIEGFVLTRDPSSSLVIMDGHVVIDDGERLSKIPSEVFKALGVSVMVHMESEPERIAGNREGDTSRSRPTYPLGILEKHQALSRAHAQAVADILGVPFHIVTHNATEQLARLLIAE